MEERLERERYEGWGAEGIENNKTSLITVGHRGVIRLLCHIVIKHVGHELECYTEWLRMKPVWEHRSAVKTLAIDKVSRQKPPQVLSITSTYAGVSHYPHTHDALRTYLWTPHYKCGPKQQLYVKNPAVPFAAVVWGISDQPGLPRCRISGLSSSNFFLSLVCAVARRSFKADSTAYSSHRLATNAPDAWVQP